MTPGDETELAMYFSDYDPAQHVMVCRFTGEVSQDHYDRCCADCRQLIENARGSGRKPLTINWIGEECEPANAEQRQQLAALAIQAKGLNYQVLVVTPSALVRGVVTAMRWIRAQPEGTDVAMLADPAAALRWTKKNRPEQAAATEQLLRNAAAALDQPKTG